MIGLPIVILIGMCQTFSFTAKQEPYEYTKKDQRTARNASLTCRSRYKGCLLSLTRKEAKGGGIHYNAICQ